MAGTAARSSASETRPIMSINGLMFTRVQLPTSEPARAAVI
jgi:hypothetical protein